LVALSWLATAVRTLVAVLEYMLKAHDKKPNASAMTIRAMRYVP